MAEKYSKSKLKRNKSSVKGPEPEVCSRETLKRNHIASFSTEIRVTAETGRSVVPAAVWWNSEQLPAVESLWALTLKSGLPYLKSQHWDLVPDLPHPFTERATALKLDDQQWCDFSEEVAPFPEPSPPSPELSFSQQEISVHTKPGTDPPERRLSCHSRQSHNDKKTSLQALPKRPRLPLHSWERPSAAAGPSKVKENEVRKGGEQEEETGPDNKLFLPNQMKVSDSRVSQQRESEKKKEEEVQRSVRGDGGAAGWGGLQSCPMCLMVFPVGFTQMDCDGHLAQCLLEVNVDMTW
ncbi:uncharacterized protein LOC117258005 isoform X2 [Epinephelus lanceolatus]